MSATKQFKILIEGKGEFDIEADSEKEALLKAEDEFNLDPEGERYSIRQVSNATLVSIEGKFTFQMNQSGLDYHDKEECKQAVDDFKDTFQRFVNAMNEQSFISLEYDFDNIEVEEGE